MDNLQNMDEDNDEIDEFNNNTYFSMDGNEINEDYVIYKIDSRNTNAHNQLKALKVLALLNPTKESLIHPELMKIFKDAIKYLAKFYYDTGLDKFLFKILLINKLLLSRASSISKHLKEKDQSWKFITKKSKAYKEYNTYVISIMDSDTISFKVYNKNHRFNLNKDEDEDENNISVKVEKLMELGYVGKAAQMLFCQQKLMPVNQNTLEKIAEILGNDDVVDSLPISNGSTSSVTINEQMMMHEVYNLNKESAPGISGWSPHLAKLWRNEEWFIKLLVRITNNMSGGKGNLQPFLCSSKLIPFAKDNGSIRPIQVGELFYRIGSGLLIKNRFNKNDLNKKQLGVGSPCGVEPIVHLLSARVGRGDDEENNLNPNNLNNNKSNNNVNNNFNNNNNLNNNNSNNNVNNNNKSYKNNRHLTIRSNNNEYMNDNNEDIHENHENIDKFNENNEKITIKYEKYEHSFENIDTFMNLPEITPKNHYKSILLSPNSTSNSINLSNFNNTTINSNNNSNSMKQRDILNNLFQDKFIVTPKRLLLKSKLSFRDLFDNQE